MKTPRTRIASIIAKRTLRDGSSRAYAKEIAALLVSEGRVDELDSCDGAGDLNRLVDVELRLYGMVGRCHKWHSYQ